MLLADRSLPLAKQERIIIFDTTLRDGEQSPGMSMNLEEKLLVAEALDAMGVDVIEAGFAQASNGDFEAVHEIASRIKNAVVCSLARAKPGDIERAAEALKPAKQFRIHTFISTSDIHLKYQFRLSREQVLEIIRDTVTLARKFTDNVEWSAMDSTRSDRDYLCKAVETAIKAGATTVNIPDTVGYATPDDYGALIAYLKNNVPNIDKAIISTHCQNDLGLATANSLAAIRNGARQIECTINGIGERAGNCSLEEVVMALRTRAGHYQIESAVETRRLYPTSRLVSNITGIHVPRNKAVVGENAFAHESGIHQDGMLKHASTYEIMRPEDVGISRSNLVLGKHSGRHAFRERVQQLGFTLDDEALNRAFGEFKKLADRKKEMFDADIEAIIMNASTDGAGGPWTLEELHITAGTGAIAAGAVRLRHADDRLVNEAAVGDGPIEAAFKALERATGVALELRNFDVRSVTMGEDAQGEVTVTVEYNGESFRGHGISTDIVEAGAQAYLDVINRICRRGSGAAAHPGRQVGRVASV